MTGSDKHIILDYPERMPDNTVIALTHKLKSNGLVVELRPNQPTAWAALDWIIPGALTAWVLKPYFDGFLKEAGKDHYLKLTVWLKELCTASRSIHTVILTASDSREKISRDSQSKSISIFFQLKDNRKLKLLFDLELSTDDWHAAVDQMVDMVMENYSPLYPNDRITLAKPFQKSDEYIYAILDRETKQWVLFDTMELVGISKKLSEKRRLEGGQ
ncbi:MAG: hypothetical protein MUF75_04785 [Bacteroidia bacterium]|nr:hypothetical protein [Bacteroidia bacterium]